jgi:hypothetical protein
MDIVWSGYITKENFFELDKFDDFNQWLGTFAPGTKIDVILKKHEERTSDPQRKYYWAVIVKMIAEYTGHEPNEIHDTLKWKFLKERDVKGIEYVKSSESLNTAEREEYHEQCRKWALIVLGVKIPLPNECVA